MGSFTDLWSVSAQGNQAQINAGKRVIYYLLGEKAQDVYYVQHAEGLPINKAMLEVYCTVNAEMYFLEEYIDKVDINNGEYESIDEYYDSVYGDEFKNDSEAVDRLIEWLGKGE